jgi:hypothetical protein
MAARCRSYAFQGVREVFGWLDYPRRRVVGLSERLRRCWRSRFFAASCVLAPFAGDSFLDCRRPYSTVLDRIGQERSCAFVIVPAMDTALKPELFREGASSLEWLGAAWKFPASERRVPEEPLHRFAPNGPIKLSMNKAGRPPVGLTFRFGRRDFSAAETFFVSMLIIYTAYIRQAQEEKSGSGNPLYNNIKPGTHARWQQRLSVAVHAGAVKSNDCVGGIRVNDRKRFRRWRVCAQKIPVGSRKMIAPLDSVLALTRTAYGDRSAVGFGDPQLQNRVALEDGASIACGYKGAVSENHCSDRHGVSGIVSGPSEAAIGASAHCAACATERKTIRAKCDAGIG